MRCRGRWDGKLGEGEGGSEIPTLYQAPMNTYHQSVTCVQIQLDRDGGAATATARKHLHGQRGQRMMFLQQIRGVWRGRANVRTRFQRHGDLYTC